MSHATKAQDEIEQIMSEIEELQQEMDAVDCSAPPAPKEEEPKADDSGPAQEPVASDDLQEFRGSGDEPSMEETLGELKEDVPAPASILEQAVAEEPDEKVTPIRSGDVMSKQYGDEEADGSLCMTLKGKMTLTLKYEYEGEEITIGFEDHKLMVRLSDGTEFKIPVSRQSVKRAQHAA